MQRLQFAITAITIAAASAAAQAQWSTNGAKIFYNAGNVGIGTNNPSHMLDVRSSGARAIFGLATAGTGTTFGVYGQSNAAKGRGVFGLANKASGTNFGVYGKTNSNAGYAGYFEGGRNYMQGRLGLGVKAPKQKLHVNGNIRLNGWIGNSANGPVTLRSANKRVGHFQHLSVTDGPLTYIGANVILGHESNTIANGVVGGTICGGGGTIPPIDQGNSVWANWATIVGGYNNIASGEGAIVSGGNFNTASGGAANVNGGYLNEASGFAACVPGGHSNTASNFYSFAAGRRAKAAHVGSFVWGDSTNADVLSSAADQVTFRASGGARIFTTGNESTGVEVAAGDGSWASVSDRNAKENFESVDVKALLEKLAAIPMMTWNYKSQDPSIRHIGPTAQDFRAAFGVGHDERRITTIDADGVALAAIQGLHQMLKEKDAELASMQQRLEKLEALLLERTAAE